MMALKTKSKRFNIVWLLLLVWLVLSLFIFDAFEKEKRLYLDKEVSNQRTSWNAIQTLHRSSFNSYFETMVNSYGVLQLLKVSKEPEKEQLARVYLYRLLHKDYLVWNRMGVDLFQFHTTDNKSFFRFHLPHMFGDDLSQIRQSVAEANRTQQPQEGFEVGKSFIGYRYVYPLMLQDEHLGSVEISQTYESLWQQVAEIDSNQKDYVFIHKKSTIPGSKEHLQTPLKESLFSTLWLQHSYQEQIPGALPEASEEVRAVAALAKNDFAVSLGLASGKDFAEAFLVNGEYVVLTFTAVKDFRGETTAYLISYQKSPTLLAGLTGTLAQILFSALLILVLGYMIVAWLKSKHQQAQNLEFLENINRTINEGLVVLDGQGKVVELNQAALNFFKVAKDEVIGQPLNLKVENDKYALDLETALLKNENYNGELKLQAGNSSSFWCYISSRPLLISGEHYGKVVVFYDISTKKQQESSLRVAAAAFETHSGILISDANGKILRVNQAFSKITGYDANEVIGKSPSLLSSGKQDREFYKAMWHALEVSGAWQGEIWNKKKSGELYLEWLSISAVKDEEGHVTQYVANFSDITEQKQAQEEVVRLAFYDPLTKLPNRRLLLERLSHALLTSARNKHYGAVIFIDLDNFKSLNDSKGHSYGDELLIEVAKRLNDSVRDVDTVARLGGDEFVILLEDVKATRDEALLIAEKVAIKILDSFKKVFHLKGIEHRSSPSLGVELFLGDDMSCDQILQHADVAMYQAKQQGRNCVRFFDPQMQAKIEDISELERDLHICWKKGFMSFQLYYQGQQDNSGKTVGAEALLRWVHPERGMVSPAEFIPMLEQNGMIREVGYWVLEQACERLGIWQQEDATRHLTLSVNVSVIQLMTPDFVTNFKKIIDASDVDPSKLKVEMTESSIVNELEKMISVMTEIRDLGVSISMDDFGTGYSSLSNLKRLPISQLKIDQSFVKDLGTGADADAIVNTIIAMAKTMNLEVIAEGVEYLDHFYHLKEHGCQLYQGFFFARPLPVEAFENKVKDDLSEKLIQFLDGSDSEAFRSFTKH